MPQRAHHVLQCSKKASVYCCKGRVLADKDLSLCRECGGFLLCQSCGLGADKCEDAKHHAITHSLWSDKEDQHLTHEQVTQKKLDQAAEKYGFIDVSSDEEEDFRLRSSQALRRKERGALVHSGWMTKKGGIRPNWLKRWFNIEPMETRLKLVYYGKPSKPFSNDEKGSIVIGSQDIVRRSEAKSAPSSAHEIELVTSERTYRLRCEDINQMKEWIRKIEEAQRWYQRRPAGGKSAAAATPPAQASAGTYKDEDDDI
eukprot:COSAG05_NODE_1095_length_5901_cov_26.506205_5_plen_257_part_00